MSLYNTYRTIDIDIILINFHSNPDNRKIKMFGYDSIQINTSAERNDGSAILIKSNLEYKQIENFNYDTLAVEIKTKYDKLIVSTLYSPPRRPQLPTDDIIKILNYNAPAIFMGDLNAKHPLFEDTTTNPKGRELEIIHRLDRMTPRGPSFPTFIGGGHSSKPDKVFTNKNFTTI